MQLSTLIRIWGVIDLGYIIWVIYSDINKGLIPFYDSFIAIVDSTGSFGLLGVAMLTYASFIVGLSIALSGILMLFLNKVGVYISFLQLPFRIFLLIPPTFFFLANLNFQSILPLWLIIMLLIALDLFKTYTQIRWIREK